VTAARKVPIAAQVAEIKKLLEVPPRADSAMAQAARIEAQRAILATLQFCLEHEPGIRSFMAMPATVREREYQLIDGGLAWRRKDGAGGDDWTPMSEAEANAALALLSAAP